MPGTKSRVRQSKEILRAAFNGNMIRLHRLFPDNARAMHSATFAKDHFRSIFRSFRRQMDDETYYEWGSSITQRVSAMEMVKASHTVHIYWPLVHLREVDTRALIHDMESSGKRILLPVYTETPDPLVPEFPTMGSAEYRGVSLLVKNKWGTLEPSSDALVPHTDVDLVFVPGFGFDRRGHRVGFGKGYYDAFLKGRQAAKIGLTYEGCLVDELPTEPHDQAVDIIVTEHRVLHIRPDATCN